MFVLNKILGVAWLIALFGVANMAPVIFCRIPILGAPVDFGRAFRGKRIFGDHKTWRGIILAVIWGFAFFLLQKYLKESNSKIEFEIVEIFEEKVSKTKKSSKIWFEKENKLWYDKTTFLQSEKELGFDKIKGFQVNQKSFLELTLKYLRKNKVDLNEGKQILENIIEFVGKF